MILKDAPAVAGLLLSLLVHLVLLAGPAAPVFPVRTETSVVPVPWGKKELSELPDIRLIALYSSRKEGTAEESFGTGGDTAAGAGDSSQAALLYQERVKKQIQKQRQYPLSARQRGLQGTVDLRFKIDGQGRPDRITVLTSSGLKVLDKAARETVSRAAPFPRPGEHGVVGPVSIQLQFVFSLNGS